LLAVFKYESNNSKEQQQETREGGPQSMEPRLDWGMGELHLSMASSAASDLYLDYGFSLPELLAAGRLLAAGSRQQQQKV
jgi:hypothetical protein